MVAANGDPLIDTSDAMETLVVNRVLAVDPKKATVASLLLGTLDHCNDGINHQNSLSIVLLSRDRQPRRHHRGLETPGHARGTEWLGRGCRDDRVMGTFVRVEVSV